MGVDFTNSIYAYAITLWVFHKNDFRQVLQCIVSSQIKISFKKLLYQNWLILQLINRFCWTIDQNTMIFAINANIFATEQRFQNDISCLIHKIKKSCYATSRKKKQCRKFWQK